MYVMMCTFGPSLMRIEGMQTRSIAFVFHQSGPHNVRETEGPSKVAVDETFSSNLGGPEVPSRRGMEGKVPMSSHFT